MAGEQVVAAAARDDKGDGEAKAPGQQCTGGQAPSGADFRGCPGLLELEVRAAGAPIAMGPTARKQPFGQRIRQSCGPDGRRGTRDVVIGSPVDGAEAVEVELQPGSPRISVARLADAAGIDQPLAVGEIELEIAVPGLAGGRRTGKARERQGDVGVTDEADAVLLGIEAELGLERGEDVLRDRVAGAGVVEADRLVGVGRLQRPFK